MHAWYHRKDYLILFKMIPYLLWLCHRGKGSIFKYGLRSQSKSCKLNTSGHIKNIFFCIWSYVFCSQLVSSESQSPSTAWGCGARRCRAGTGVVHLIPSPDHVIEINEHWWNQLINTMSDLPNLGHFATFQFWPYPTFQSTAPPFKP